jgi:excisionase family DNA binding protein
VARRALCHGFGSRAESVVVAARDRRLFAWNNRRLPTGGATCPDVPPRTTSISLNSREYVQADEYLTVAEIAKELKLNEQRIRNWIDRRELRAVRVGARRVRVLRSDLDRLLAEGATAPAGEDQTQVDQGGEIRRRLDPSLKRARDALATDRKSDLAAALSALLHAAEQAIAILEQSGSSPAPDAPGEQPSDAAPPPAASGRP